VSCEEEAAGGSSHCWRNTLTGIRTILSGCRKACSKCEASGADICDESSWPDKAHGIVCGECKVLVHKSIGGHRTCAGYCASLGLPCTGAWEGSGRLGEDGSWEDTCAVNHEMTCDQSLSSYISLSSSGAICECNPAAEVTGGVLDDKDGGVVSQLGDGSMRFFVASLPWRFFALLCLFFSMFRFFIWKQTATNSTQSMEKAASNDVVGNLTHDSPVRASEDIEQPLLS